MPDVPISAGTGASDSGAMAGLPAKTTGFDKTVTAMVRRDVLENIREVSRWLVPGAYIPGTFIPGTNLIRHIAYGDLTVASGIIAIEGEPPDELPLTIGYAEYAATQRGRLVGITDVALGMNPHELMSIAADKVAYDAKMTVDRSIAAAFAAGTGIPLTLAGATLTAADIRKWVAIMKSKLLPTFPDGYYIAMVHPAVVADLMNDTAIGGWIEASKYAAPGQLLNGEIGRMYGVRFIETTIGTSTTGSPDTYNTYVLSPDSFAFGDMQSIQTYMVRPGGDHSDPLAQKALVGYKGMWGAAVLAVAEAGGVRYGEAAAHAGTDLT